jgi:hypothetical protein
METTFQPPQVAPLLPDELDTPPFSLGQLVWRRFRRHKMAMFGAVTLIVLFVFAFGGALVFPESYANLPTRPCACHHLRSTSIRTDTIDAM